MSANKLYSVLINVIVANDKDEILLSQRSFEEEHAPGKWTVPGGKIENEDGDDDIINIVEQTAKREVMEEVGVKIDDDLHFIYNKIFRRSTGQMVLALIFLAKYKSGEPKALEDTINVKWVKHDELDNYDYPPFIREVLETAYTNLNS
jgi:mutator protein MutT